MTQEIHSSDYTLGSRFWLNANSDQFANELKPLQEPLQQQVVTDDTIKRLGIMESVTLNTFGSNSDAEKEAIGRAELFAATHTITEDERQNADQKAGLIAHDLGINLDDFKAQIQTLAQKFSATTEGSWLQMNDDTRKAIDIALRNILVSDECIERAKSGELSDIGKLSLVNTVFGVTKLICEKTISEKAVLALLNGKLYDLTQSQDMLAEALEQARTARRQFVDEAGVNDALAAAKRAIIDTIARLPQTPEMDKLKTRMLENYGKLAMRGQAIIAERMKFSKALDQKLELVDTTGKLDTKKFHETQLHRIRDLMRAFRYDLDVASGKPMGKRESLRRVLDNWWNGSKDLMTGELKQRITREDFSRMRTMTETFNQELAMLMLPPELAGQDTPCSQLAKNASGWRLDFGKAVGDSTYTTHDTCSYIRYYFTGVKQSRLAKEQEIHAILDTIARRGGSRKAKMNVGMDFIMGLDTSLTKANFKAGAAATLDARIEVPPGGGKLRVTYEYGGEAHAGVDAVIGVDAREEEPKKGGVGVDVEAKATAGYKRTYVKEYDDVNQFLAEASGSELFLYDTGIQWLFSKIGQGIKGLGHLCTLGVTALKLRISKSKFDEVAYANKMRDNGTLKRLDGLVMNKMNAFTRSTATSNKLYAEGKASAKGGIYNLKEDELVSTLDFGGKISGQLTREFGISQTSYRKLSEVFGHYSEAGLVKALLREFDAMNDNVLAKDKTFRDDAEEIFALSASGSVRPHDIANALTGILKRFEAMEARASALPATNTDAWKAFAQTARMAAVGIILLAKRAEKLPEDDRKQLAPALNFAKETMLQNVTNPHVKVPSDIYRDIMTNHYDFGLPSKTINEDRISVEVAKPLDFIPEATPAKVDKKELLKPNFANTMAAQGNNALNTVISTAADTTKSQFFGDKFKLEIAYKGEIPSATNPDTRPFKNQIKDTLEVKVSTSMPLRYLVDAIAKAYVQKVGGKDNADDVRLLDQIKGEIAFNLTMMGVSLTASTVGALLKTPIQLAAMKSKTFASVLGGLATAASFLEMGENRWETDKILQWNFADGRFDSFTVASSTSSGMRLNTTEAIPLPIQAHLSLELDVATNDRTVYVSPSVDTLLDRLNDLATTHNPTLMNRFLTFNQKGVLRMYDIAQNRDNAINDTDDKYAEQDRQVLNRRIEQARAILNRIGADETDPLHEEAQNVKTALENALTTIGQQDENTVVNEKMEALSKLFTAVAATFSLELQSPQAAA